MKNKSISVVMFNLENDAKAFGVFENLEDANDVARKLNSKVYEMQKTIMELEDEASYELIDKMNRDLNDLMTSFFENSEMGHWQIFFSEEDIENLHFQVQHTDLYSPSIRAKLDVIL